MRVVSAVGEKTTAVSEAVALVEVNTGDGFQRSNSRRWDGSNSVAHDGAARASEARKGREARNLLLHGASRSSDAGRAADTSRASYLG